LALFNRFEFENIVKKLDKAKVDLPKLVASDIRNYFVNSFRRQGFDGQKWQEVKRREKENQTAKDKKPILIQTGRLRRSVNESIRKTTWQEIILGIDTPYAVYHNEGTDKIPKRQFMGQSKELDEKVKNRIERTIKKIIQTQGK
jgi:phage gpG-like protein